MRARARLNQIIRRFFDERGFVEIEAPIMVPSPGLELHLDAYEVAGGHRGQPRFLITSPEYQLKRLVAGGLARIYSLGKVFRRGEEGPHHNPEFTMLEWYRAGEGWEAVAADVEALVSTAADELAPSAGISLRPPWTRLSVTEVMRLHAGVQVDGDEDADTLRQRVRAAGHRAPADGDWSDAFFTVFLDAVEPKLAASQAPVVLYDWPRPLAALAREKPGDPRVVERFEAYLSGLELCNGFGELIDPVEQRRRLQADLAERARRGLPLYPIDERFLAAVGHMPASGGVALGVDRLAMLLLGKSHIRDVLPFSAAEL